MPSYSAASDTGSQLSIALFPDQMLPIFLEYFSLLSGAYISPQNAGIIIPLNSLSIELGLSFLPCLMQRFSKPKYISFINVPIFLVIIV